MGWPIGPGVAQGYFWFHSSVFEVKSIHVHFHGLTALTKLVAYMAVLLLRSRQRHNDHITEVAGEVVRCNMGASQFFQLITSNKLIVLHSG